LREILTKRIQEAENFGKALREKQKMVKASAGTGMKQLDLWRDVERLTQTRLEALRGEEGIVVGGGASGGEERMVL
jgi:hypothetical protein